MEKVSKDFAEKEVNRFLDFKKVGKLKREDNFDGVNTLVDAVMCGDIEIDENCIITHKLQFPITNDEGEITVRELVYQPRLRVDKIQSSMKGVKANDADGRILAYINAITDKPKGILRHLESTDYSICQGIAVFFL